MKRLFCDRCGKEIPARTSFADIIADAMNKLADACKSMRKAAQPEFTIYIEPNIFTKEERQPAQLCKQCETAFRKFMNNIQEPEKLKGNETKVVIVDDIKPKNK